MKTKKRIFLIGAVLSFISIVALFISMAVVTRMWPSEAVSPVGPVGVYTYLNKDSDFILDGSGGIILAGVKGTTSNPDIYAQRIDSGGMLSWMRWRRWGWGWGRAVCTAVRRQEKPRLVSDGAGGAIIVWEDYRNYSIKRPDIYAQRINADGDRLWFPSDGSDGIVITNAEGGQAASDLISDGRGGAIIFWHDDMNGGDIYAQRIDSFGNLLWDPNGLPICSADGNQGVFKFISDGNGGIIITWVDAESASNPNIYAQRIDLEDDSISWDVRGVSISAEEGLQWSHDITSDGNGGAIITWVDHMSEDARIYAQRIGTDGNSLWAPGGVQISTGENSQLKPNIVSDGDGGAIITWHGRISGDWRYDIYAQRINEYGERQWGSSGVLLCGESGSQVNPKIAPYNFNSFIVVWEDYRGGSSRSVDIYAQGVNLNGTVPWEEPDGIVVIDNTRDNRNPEILPGGIIRWQDISWNRTYVQKISYIPDDIDEDGVLNEGDLDIDGDGIRNERDPDNTTRALGVVACYEFNNARDVIPGTSIPDLGFDSSGNNNTLTNVDGVASVSDRFGNAAQFTAADRTYLTIPPEEQQDNLHITGDMTVSAWIKINSYPSQGFIIAAKQEGEFGEFVDYSFYIENGLLKSWDGSGNIGPDVIVSTGEWHHVAFVRRSGDILFDILFYLDGSLVGTATQTFPRPAENAPFYIGHNGLSAYGDGEIDEVAIYDRALAEGDIREFGT